MTDKKDVAVRTEDPFLQMVERVAANQDIDADKLQKILDMQMQVMDRNARDEFYVAMNDVQSKLPAIAKEATNPQTSSRYAKLETIVAQIRPIYTMHGFSTSFSQEKSDTEGYIRIAGTLRHKSGHSEKYHVDLPADSTGIKGQVNKTMVHATGSTFTYGRRYLTCLMFDIATGDDLDGNLPDAFVTEEQAMNIQALVEELSEEDQQAFWHKARVDSYDELLAHRYKTYIDWLEKKRAEA